MDIKLKNIKYSMGLKITAVILVWLCFMSAFGSGLFLLYNEEIIASSSYFDTYMFKNEFLRLTHNVVEWNVKLKSEEDIKASGEDEKIIEQNLDRLQRIKMNLSDKVNFLYYIKNTETGGTFTNVTHADAVSFIEDQPHTFFSELLKPDFNYSQQEDIKQMITGTPYQVYTAVLEPLKPGDVFYDAFTNFNRVKEYQSLAISLFVSSLVIMIGAFIYLVLVTGRSEKGEEIGLPFVDRIYTDVHTLLVFIAAMVSVSIGSGFYHYYHTAEIIFIAVVLSIDVFIGLSYILSMIRQIMKGQIIKNSLTYKIYKKIKHFVILCFNGKIFKVWILLLLLGYGAINSIIFALATHSHDGFWIVLLQLVFNAVCIYFAAKSLSSLTMIMNAAKEISVGNIDYPLDKSKISIAFMGFAGDILSIQGGLKRAVDEAIRGERMKTDLITNVSHDLKTPLTSIVNYVDLLKREELKNEKAIEYVGVLEEKSGRLKQLIEDLVEASKASSGNLAVSKEKVDLQELLLQACGEYEEKIKKADLDVRINSDDKNILIDADGKHMWRIIENLLSNVVKYSMPHSRVYVNTGRDEKYGFMTIKNMSAYPLNISPEQLTERFVRGDESRTTEGSGLGLSIAQSLVSLQGGKFDIDIDGDLFKVKVEIPLWEE